jgi:hypothetical protein
LPGVLNPSFVGLLCGWDTAPAYTSRVSYPTRLPHLHASADSTGKESEKAAGKWPDTFGGKQCDSLHYIAREEDLHVYMLGDTAIAMYMKEYAVRANPNQVDRQDLTDVFVKGAGTWKLKISRSSPHKNPESCA